MFEHMMFKGNEHLTPDSIDELTENVGGANNAYTADDVTVYHEEIPSNYLEPILWAEGERMSSLALTESNFVSERDVVKEEYRQRVLADPYGEFYLDTEKKSFVVHPYKRPGIGSIEELDASKLPEVRAFHATFYRPDNATLIVVGDFQLAELDAWVKKYLQPVVRPGGKIPRVTAKEPPRKQDQRYVIHSPKVPLPAVAVSYLGPSIKGKDTGPLLIAEEIMSGGESSRLYQSLVYEKQVAQKVSCSADLREDVGLILFTAVIASGKTSVEAERLLDEQIQNLLKNGVSEQELAKAKNRLLTAKLLKRETTNGKADALGEAVVIFGDPNRVNTDLRDLQAVTAVRVKEAFAKYVFGKKKVVLEYLPQSKESEKAQPREEPQ